MYHSIDATGSAISVAPDEFRAHIKWLASGTVRVVPLEALRGIPPAENAVAITFDDGFANFGTEAAPLLLEHGLPATLFVVSEVAGGTNDWGGKAAPGIPTLPLLAWPELRKLAEQGIALGGHTRTHPRLAGLPDSRLTDEIAGSAERIEQETGKRPQSFAYPYGSYDGRAAAVAAATYREACTTELRVLGDADSSHLLPRLDMYYFRKPGRLESWGTQSFQWRLRIRAHARGLKQALSPAKGRRP
jgi:peptidoglycan/xylan/chitin deacetylase (PgdA/CDA1 family)